MSRRLDDLIGSEADELSLAWCELLALGEAKRDHRALSASCGPRLLECSYRAAVHAGRHLCIARDITERRLFEERLAQSDKVESVGRLAGGIAHDFNNLLTAILGYTELLLGSREPDDPDRRDLEEIQKAGQRAATLTQQLLAYSRRQMLLPKEVDLNQTVLGLQGMLTRLIREDISLTYQLAPTPALVKIDPTQLEQVIVNLVLNARDAIPAAGSIRLEVARVPLTEVDLPSDTHVRPAEYVRLRVIDDGVGIAPEARARLFEPFSTKEIGKGAGLGLASVHGIVRQSNGFIGVDSQPGRGTTFTMHFPAITSAAAADAPSAARLASLRRTRDHPVGRGRRCRSHDRRCRAPAAGIPGARSVLWARGVRNLRGGKRRDRPAGDRRRHAGNERAVARAASRRDPAGAQGPLHVGIRRWGVRCRRSQRELPQQAVSGVGSGHQGAGSAVAAAPGA